MSIQPVKTTPAAFVPKLSARPPRGCDVALVCFHPGCHLVWYFASVLEALNAHHGHPDSLHIFERRFVPTTQTLSGMALWKYLWEEYR